MISDWSGGYGARTRKAYGYKAYIYVAIVLYSIVCSVIMLAFYNSFRVYTWDLGLFNQALWTTLNGRFFYYTCEPFYTTTGCFLGTHFGPILFLVLPFYAVFPSPEILLVISPIIVALGAIPAYGIAQLLLKDDKVAAFLGIFYLLYVPLQGVTISGFSLELLALPLYLFVIYFLLKGDFKKLSVAVLLGLMTHEISAIIIAFIGLYGAWYYKSIKSRGFKISIVMSIISVVYFAFAQNMRILLGWTQEPSLWHEWSLIGAESPTNLPAKIITNPLGALNSLACNGFTKISYILMLLVPAAFLPLFGISALLPTLPYLFLSLFSSYEPYFSIEGHYGAFLVPFFYVATVLGILKLKNSRYHIFPSRTAKVVLLLSTVSLIAIPSVAFFKYSWLNSTSQHAKIVYDAIAMIPQNASVLTQNDIFPHLSSRANAYTIPPPVWADEYRRVGQDVLRNLSRTKIDYVLVDLEGEPYAVSSGRLILDQFVFKRGHYEEIMHRDGVMLFKLKN
jgi:uncharacterized membrane protein